MTDQLPVTLDDLKRAIAAKEQAWADDNVSDYSAAVLRAEAWRTAFEWREGWLNRQAQHSEFGLGSRSALRREHDEGMKLIAEKLR